MISIHSPRSIPCLLENNGDIGQQPAANDGKRRLPSFAASCCPISPLFSDQDRADHLYRPVACKASHDMIAQKAISRNSFVPSSFLCCNQLLSTTTAYTKGNKSVCCLRRTCLFKQLTLNPRSTPSVMALTSPSESNDSGIEVLEVRFTSQGPPGQGQERSPSPSAPRPESSLPVQSQQNVQGAVRTIYQMPNVIMTGHLRFRTSKAVVARTGLSSHGQYLPWRSVYNPTVADAFLGLS